MTKRWMPMLLVGTMVLATAGACDPPPPPGWKRPVVENMAVSPDPVTAGSSLTITATVTDDKQVHSIVPIFEQPNGRDPAVISCGDSGANGEAVVHVAITCSITDFALNGTWDVWLQVSDGETHHIHGANYGWGHTTMEVTGGSNDLTAPALDSWTMSPEPVVAGEAFTVTFRAFDDHLVSPQLGSYVGYSAYGVVPPRKWDCVGVSRQVISPTLHEWTFTCPANPELVPGLHAWQFTLRDLNANVASVWTDFEVVPAP